MTGADNWLSAQTFTDACAALPLVSIDLMVTRPGAHGEELLLGLRNNRPAQHWWFTPGGRIRNNEALQAAMGRRASQSDLAHDHVRLVAQRMCARCGAPAWRRIRDDHAACP
jgi:8-oxo-dGTP pyrophosphatase MutT (NUDIX family)